MTSGEDLVKRTLAVALAVAVTVPLSGHASGSSGAAAPVIKVLSNRADLVSGGDALVEVVVPAKSNPSRVKVDVDGRDVTSVFAVRPDGRFYGLVDRLRVGVNTLTARGPGGAARLTVTNHPVGGPVFAGPQVQPWNCATVEARLGSPRDAQCNAPARVELLYKSALTGMFNPYDPNNPPVDMATTTTEQGDTVPYIVRREIGTVDRGIYHFVVLWDPQAPMWRPWAPQPTWNHKLAWFFGGGCAPQHGRGQPQDMLDPLGVEPGIAEGVEFALSRGFALATTSLNMLGSQCNDVVSAEALMMAKERFIETYGPVRYTIGYGASGGSMQQHWITSNYPGLLDAIQPYASYPDIWETVQEAEDCYLLDRHFDSSTLWAVTAQRSAVAGYAAETVCRSLWDTPGYARLRSNLARSDQRRRLRPAC